MAVFPIDLPDIGQVKHNTSDIPGERPVEIFFYETVTAVAVGNAGNRVLGYGVIKLEKRLKSIKMNKKDRTKETHKRMQRARTWASSATVR